jgi:hypothetical protein
MRSPGLPGRILFGKIVSHLRDELPDAKQLPDS